MVWQAVVERMEQQAPASVMARLALEQALFEAMAIFWLKQASTKAVADALELSWNAVDGIMQRAVHRGLARRTEIAPTQVSVDETSFQKGHEYVTVVTDQQDGRVLYVADDRTRECLETFYKGLSDQQRAGIRAVAMDMWPAYIHAPRACVPDADSKIAFDKFHVAQYLGDGVDKVRCEENRRLMRSGDITLKGTKYKWLRNPTRMTPAQKLEFGVLRDSHLKTARAWAMKEMAMDICGVAGQRRHGMSGWAGRNAADWGR